MPKEGVVSPSRQPLGASPQGTSFWADEAGREIKVYVKKAHE